MDKLQLSPHFCYVEASVVSELERSDHGNVNKSTAFIAKCVKVKSKWISSVVLCT